MAQIAVSNWYEPIRHEGMSMLPTIGDGDRLLVNTHSGPAVRGDLILFLYPRDQSKSFVKRIVGLPGEKLRIDAAGRVYVNGRQLNERYTRPEFNRTPTEVREQLIPSGTCFVIGDDRDWSNDSRFFGPLPLRLIRGRVIARYWPLGKPLEKAPQ